MLYTGINGYIRVYPAWEINSVQFRVEVAVENGYCNVKVNQIFKEMENLRNSVRLSGFAGSDPVIITYENQKRMARVSIAVNEFYQNNSGELVNQTQWFSLIFWNKKVELVEKAIKKGSRFSIEGKLNSQRYTDKKGEPRYTFEIVVNTIALINKDDEALCVDVE